MKGLTPQNASVLKLRVTLVFVFMVISAICVPPTGAWPAPGGSPDNDIIPFFQDLRIAQETLAQRVAGKPNPDRDFPVTGIATENRGFETDYPGATGVTFSVAGRDLNDLYLRHHLLDSRLSLVAGFAGTTEDVDGYTNINLWSDYGNSAFSTIQTIPIPDQGLGVALRLQAVDQFYVAGGLADTGSDATDTGGNFNSFFDQSEYFTYIAAGWTSSVKSRFDNTIHLGAWHADERKQDLVEEGWGLAVSLSTRINDTWLPFVRADYTNGGGALLEASLSTGAQFYFKESEAVIGFGLSWGRPPGNDRDDQVTTELFHRLQLDPKLAVTTGLQWTRNPVSEPEQNQVWVLGVQLSMDF